MEEMCCLAIKDQIMTGQNVVMCRITDLSRWLQPVLCVE